WPRPPSSPITTRTFSSGTTRSRSRSPRTTRAASRRRTLRSLPRRRRWPRVERGRRDAARGLAELDRPVGLVEERLPRLVLLAAQPERDQRVASGLLGGPNQLHAGLLGRAAPFAGVAPDAGA